MPRAASLGGLASAVGPRFFESLVETLAGLTGADCVLIARHGDELPARARTLALYVDGAHSSELEYDLTGTPCAQLVRGEACAYALEVKREFPEDPELERMGVEAYAGVPLFDSVGAVLGYIAVLHRSVRADIADVLALLESYAPRAASELERTLGEEALRRREARLTRQNTMLVDLARSSAVESGDREAFLREVTEGIAHTLELERAVVCLFEGGFERLVIVDQYDAAADTHSAGGSLRVDDCPRYLETLESSRFLDVTDTAADPRLQEVYERYSRPNGVLSTLDAPIRIHRRLIGVICCESVSTRRAWRTDEELFAASIADVVSLGLEAIDLRAAQREVRSRNRALSALQRVSDISLRAHTLEQALDEIVRETADLTGFPAVWLTLVDPRSGRAAPAAGHGLFEETGLARVRTEDFDVRRALTTGEAVVRAAGEGGSTEPGGLFLALPLVRAQDVLGALCLWDPAGECAEPEALALMRGLASAVASLVERSRAREQAEQLQERLRQSQKLEAIGTLAGGVAHDFNNLLTGILGYTWLLKQNAAPEGDVYHAAVVIENAAERAAELTRQLLGFARQGRHQEVPVDLNQLVAEVTELLGRTFDKAVAVHVAPPAYELRVLGDPGQLHQVLLNLAINARDAMPAGGDLYFQTGVVEGARVPRSAHPHLGRGPHAVLEVQDSGCGIRESDLRRIFEPFFTTKAQGKGSGMGLAMVYGIVQAHHGAIEVESREQVGST
ncbi:MAG TPA: GAF domain-containing protein, partial [Planctomycetota bacterium]|nr:GAF domain-containing protein [Planctomycetota bacterium]